jgi:hypothetical protein
VIEQNPTPNEERSGLLKESSFSNATSGLSPAIKASSDAITAKTASAAAAAAIGAVVRFGGGFLTAPVGSVAPVPPNSAPLAVPLYASSMQNLTDITAAAAAASVAAPDISAIKGAFANDEAATALAAAVAAADALRLHEKQILEPVEVISRTGLASEKFSFGLCPAQLPDPPVPRPHQSEGATDAVASFGVVSTGREPTVAVDSQLSVDHKPLPRVLHALNRSTNVVATVGGQVRVSLPLNVRGNISVGKPAVSHRRGATDGEI